jgi:multiple sugar transport system ATP-binding protein
MNLLAGEVREGRFRTGPLAFELAGARDGRVLAGIRPEDFRLAAGEGALTGRVEFTEQLGPETLVYFRADGVERAQAPSSADPQADGRSRDLEAMLVARLGADAAVAAGATVALEVNAERVSLFDPATGAALTAPSPALAPAG